jgi:hypothetical protein
MGVSLSMEIGEGWRVLNEERARLFMLGRGRSDFDDPTQAFVFITVPDSNAETVLTLIQNEPGLDRASVMREITPGGFPGFQMDFSAKPNPGYEGDEQAEIPPGVQFLPIVNEYFNSGFSWTTWTPESRLRFIALDLGGEVLLLEIEAPPDEFEEFAREANQVLQSLAPMK